MEAAGYADDIVLLAPCRETMARMLSKCEEYAQKHNLQFSTDDNPKKSKSKCLLINGKVGDILPRHLPEPLQLYGKNLPWVVTATHLGHELHQSGTMEYDCRIKRAMFIDSSIEIRESFSFALPLHVLKAVQLNSLHCYGGMLWNFGSARSSQFYKAWNTCVKLVHKVPRTTHTYISENLLAGEFLPVQQELLKFLKNLKKSPSSEVRLLSRIVTNDLYSATAVNSALIQRDTALDPCSVSSRLIRQQDMRRTVPDEDAWRLPVLSKLLSDRRELQTGLQDTSDLDLVIAGLCST